VYVRAATEAERCEGKEPVTEFGWMCENLGIRIIAASSPQAKGHVERVHGTPSEPIGEEAAAGRDRGLRCQSLSGGPLHRRAQPVLRAAGGGGGRSSPATTTVRNSSG